MAFLYISEYQAPADGVTPPDVNAAGWVTDQKIAVGVSTAPSAAFSSKTGFVLLNPDVVCSIAWTLPGASVNVATAGNMRLAAGLVYRFAVMPGMIVSNITNT